MILMKISFSSILKRACELNGYFATALAAISIQKFKIVTSVFQFLFIQKNSTCKIQPFLEEWYVVMIAFKYTGVNKKVVCLKKIQHVIRKDSESINFKISVEENV